MIDFDKMAVNSLEESRKWENESCKLIEDNYRAIREAARKRQHNLDIETRRNGWERWHAKQRRSVTHEGVPVGRKLAQAMQDFVKS